MRALSHGNRVDIDDPEEMLGMVGNKQLQPIAEEAKERLQRVVASLSGQV